MDMIANKVKQIANNTDVKNEYDLKDVLIKINDVIGEDETGISKSLVDVTSKIISKIVEDGLSMWKSIEIFSMLKSTEIWNTVSVNSLYRIVWPTKPEFSETCVARSRRRFF